MSTFLRKNRAFIKHLILSIPFLIGSVESSFSLLNPISLDKVLIRRDYYLSKIRDSLNGEENIIVLVGGSGVGKTQLSKDYFSKYGNQYEIVWWFNYNESFYDQLKQFAKALNKLSQSNHKIEVEQTTLEYLTYQVKEFLRETDKSWLLIYDDVVDYDHVKDFIFRSKKHSYGHNIISSKNDLCWKNMIKIKKFNREESRELIGKITLSQDIEDVDQLADLLDDYPLAISQAATFVRHTGLPNCKEYVEQFKTARKTLWEKEEKIFDQNSQLHDRHATIHTTMKMSLDNLKKKSTSAYKLYKCLGVLYKKNMHIKLIRDLYDELIPGYTSKEKEIQLQNDIDLIISEGLLDRESLNGEITFSRHEMFQYAIEDFISDDDKKVFLSAIARVIAKLSDLHWDDLVEFISKNSWLSIQSHHLIQAADKERFINDDVIKIKIKILEYNVYHERNHKLYEQQASEIRNLIKKRSIPLKEKACFYIDSVYDRTLYEGNTEETEKNMKWAVDYLRQTKDTKEFFRSLINIANFYFFLNKMDIALTYLKEANFMKEKVGSKSYLNLYFYINGWLLSENGDYRQAYEQVASFLNNFETNTSSSLRLLILTLGAECQLEFRNFDKAEKLANTAIEDSRKFYQSDKSEIMALSTLILAQCYKEKNNLEKASELVKKAKEIYFDYFGGDRRHPDQAIAYILMGDIYKLKNLHKLAIEEYLEAEKILNSVAENKETLKISDLYKKIYCLSLEMNDEEVANSYFKKHKEIFGVQNQSTLEMARDLPS